MANPISRRAALAALLLGLPLLAQTRRLLPVDESGRDPSLVVYLTKLTDAVSKRDQGALMALVHPDIKLSFDEPNGIANFKPEWPVLERLLMLGGAWQDGSYSIPYVFVKFPNDLDAFEYAAVTGAGVWLRAEPGTGSRGMRQLTYEIIRVKNYGTDWWEVTTLRGENGYVSGRYIHSPIGYRAMFQKNERGEWKMYALLAGD